MNIIQALNEEELEFIVKCLEKCDWFDGKGSAVGKAKEKKVNSQAYANQEHFEPINLLLNDLIFKKLKHYAFPANLVGVRASLYTGDQKGHYDWHVDYSHMDGSRTDLSFTLFLSDKTKYTGGELDIESRGLNIAVKGQSGEIVLYSTGDRHRVRPVTDGTRLVIVGWISSLVPDLDKRDALIDYWNILNSFGNTEKEEELKTKVNENYMRMLRLLSL